MMRVESGTSTREFRGDGRGAVDSMSRGRSSAWTVKTVNTATGAAGEYLKLKVCPQPI